MKILAIAESAYPEGLGGTFSTYRILDLLKNDVELTVLTGTRHPRIPAGVKYLYCDLLHAPNKIALWCNLLIVSRTEWFAKLVTNVDLVYIPCFAYPLVPKVKAMGKNVVVHLHDYQPLTFNGIVTDDTRTKNFQGKKELIQMEMAETGNPARIAFSVFASPTNTIVYRWMDDADAIWCNSERHATIMKTAIPAYKNKIKPVFNPAPVMRFHKKSLNSTSFLYLGGRRYVKGPHIFLAASLIHSRKQKASYVMTGMSDSERILLQGLSQARGLALEVMNMVPHEFVSDLYASASALVVPSLWEETLGMVVVESMLVGTPPIASRVGGIPEIVAGTPAEELLFAKGDVDELVEKMETVGSWSQGHLVDVGFSLREETLRKFDLQKLRSRYLSLLVEAQSRA